MNRDQEIQASLERAEESIKAAKALLQGDYHDFAASRAYYAVFYASTALLLSRGSTFRKHSGVITSIHREFVKTGQLDVAQGKTLNWLFELRGVGDYGMMLHVSREEAEKAIAAAEEFLSAVLPLINTP